VEPLPQFHHSSPTLVKVQALDGSFSIPASVNQLVEAGVMFGSALSLQITVAAGFTQATVFIE
jgi:hypothetical protein